MSFGSNGSDNAVELSLKDILESVRREPTYLNYWNAYRRIRRLDLTKLSVDEKRRIKIALLSSFTIEPLAIYLDIESRLAGLHPEIYISPFNQYPQEILNDESDLYKFDPDLIIIAVHAEALLEESFLPRFVLLSEGEKRERQEEIINLSLIHI
mgnify:CR=1 FL=1